jgi:dTMP kinase
VLVAFEGIDGAGKTTQAQALVESLASVGYDVVYAKEPTDGPWGRKIRLSAESGRMPLEEELAAFLEDRREHVRDFLIPSLAAGKIVVLDRYYFSTAAYQGARGCDPAEILRTNESFAPPPDMLVILEIPVLVSLERIRIRGGYAVNHFEEAAALARSAEIFGSLELPYIRRFDGTRGIDDLACSILNEVQLGPISDARIPSRGPCIPPEQVPRILDEVRRIKDDDSIAVEDKARAAFETMLRGFR